MGKMQQLDDDDEELAYSTTTGKGGAEEEAKKLMAGGDVRPAWMRALQESTSNWLSTLPEKLTPPRRTAENIKDPLYRFYEREVNLGCKILKRVRSDLRDVIAICRARPADYPPPFPTRRGRLASRASPCLSTST